jgi:hypothetical protein
LENYDVFISYPRNYAGIASSIHKGLEKYAKEKNNIRALRIFLDSSSLTVNDDLSESIKSALNKANYFILLASPESANSRWVKQELEYFYGLKGNTKNILIILISGEILWDADANNFEKTITTAIPVAYEQIFIKEPLYIDFRWMLNEPTLRLSNPKFRTGIAKLASSIRGIPLDSLEGEYLEEQSLLYKRYRTSLGLRTFIGVLLGCLALFFITFKLLSVLGFFWSFVSGCFACGLILSIILGLGKKNVIAYCTYFLILPIIYCFFAVRPLNDNFFDVLVQIIFLTLSFTGFGLVIGCFDKKLKTEGLFAFLVGGVIASIIWYFTETYFHIDFQTYQTPWFFTRLELTYKLLNVKEFDDVGSDVSTNNIFLPLIVGIFVGSLLFSLLLAGKEFVEIQTTNNKIERLKANINRKYLQVFFLLMGVLLSCYLIWLHSNRHLEKIARENLKIEAFKSARVEPTKQPGWIGIIFNCSNTLEKAGYTNQAREVKNFGVSVLKEAVSRNDYVGTSYNSDSWNVIYSLKKAGITDSLILQFIKKIDRNAVANNYEEHFGFPGSPIDSIMLSRYWRTYGNIAKSNEILVTITNRYTPFVYQPRLTEEYLLIGTELYYHNKKEEAKSYFNYVLLTLNSQYQAKNTDVFNSEYNKPITDETANILDSLGYWSKDSELKYPLLKLMCKSGYVNDMKVTKTGNEFYAFIAKAGKYQQDDKNRLALIALGDAWYNAHPYHSGYNCHPIRIMVYNLVSLGKLSAATSVANEAKNKDFYFTNEDEIIEANRVILESIVK